MAERKYQWSFAELIDRLSIVIQKVVHSEDVNMRAVFADERDDIIHDLNLYLQEGVKVDGEMISHICYLQLINATIWQNESAFRGDGDGANLKLTHGLNSDRATIKRHISERSKGRVDYKLNYNSGYWDMFL